VANFKLSSEKMRVEAGAIVGDSINSKLMPFTFPLKDTHHSVDIRNVPMSYIPNLWERIEHTLNANLPTGR